MSSVSTKPIQHIDLSTEELIKHALSRGEGRIASMGALCVETGARTGRSPLDRFIVKDKLTENSVKWGEVNQPVSPQTFETLWERANNYLAAKEECFISHCRVGASEEHFLPVKVITEMAWQNLFARHLFICDKSDYAEGKSPWVMLSVPGFKTDPERDGTHSDGTVMIDFSGKRVLLCGMRYAGEMKKAMFSVMNYFMPEKDVLPMHCAANMGDDGDVALFFGLSGTGKTTLSADPSRYLIGDDEHGWSKNGVFNIEGGCYAKCINLSEKHEPLIWAAIREGTIMENVVLTGASLVPDFDDDSLTQNSRAAYPREFIPNCVEENRGGIPKTVIFLTCDLYGVLPPISLLTKEQAAFHFLSGYTAKVGSTEMGSSANVAPTFSTCFGAPFFPRPAAVYAELLIKRIEESGAQVYLINTGWTGGAYEKGGKRFSIPTTRTIVSAAIAGDLLNAPTQTLPGFNLRVPKQIAGIDDKLLNPKLCWTDAQVFEKNLNELIRKFNENMKKFIVPESILAAAPVEV